MNLEISVLKKMKYGNSNDKIIQFALTELKNIFDEELIVILLPINQKCQSGFPVFKHFNQVT